MLNKLKDLVFGFNEFEKTKFDLRFEMILLLIPDIKIKELSDFENLEKIIYKINELLRIKSSNLNRAIRDKSNNLTKKKVLKVLEDLNNIKYNFLKKVFSNYLENNSNELSNYGENIKKVETNLVENLNTDFKENSDFNKNSRNDSGFKFNDLNTEKNPNNFEIPKNINNSKKLNNFNKSNNSNNPNLNNLLFKNDLFQIIIKFNKIPYLEIQFNQDLNLSIINDISNLFFEVYKPEGTNIIITDKTCFVLPRFKDDNLINLPNVNIDLNLVYKKITAEILKENSSKKEKEIKNKSNSNIEDNYLNVREKIDFKTSKKKEDSLDELLEKQVESKDFISIKNNLKSNEKDEIGKNDENYIENLRKSELKIINDDSKIEVDRKKEIIKKKGIEIEFGEENKKNNEIIKNEEVNNKGRDFLIYEDDEIQVSLDFSEVFGVLNISSKKNKSFSELNESELSYLFIFSKVFSSILFDVLKLEGTNIIWDFNKNNLKIIPRKTNDGLERFFLKGKKESDEFLNQIKDRLISEMNKSLMKENEVGIKEGLNRTEDLNKDKKLNENTSNEKEKNNDDKSLMEEKARYILESLKRIP